MPDPIAIHTNAAPAAVGPYSQAMQAHNLVFCSGQIGLDPATGIMVPGGLVPQTHQVLSNLKAVLRAAGCEPAGILKTTVYLTNMEHFATVNQIYESELAPARPARACIAVAALPKGALVEIDAIATSESGL